MRKIVALLVVGFIVAAYVAGYWPEHQRRLALDSEARALRERLAEAEAKLRTAGLLAEALTLTDVVGAKDYGQAQTLATRFFDHVRAESGRTPAGASQDALEGVLSMRDALTAGLTKADPAALEILKGVQARLRSTLGFAAPPAPAAGAASAPPASPAPAPSAAATAGPPEPQE